jgi:ATP-binding cassette subfamily B protein
MLASDENVRAALAVDLDGALRFGEGVIVVTTRRLLALAPGQNDWQTWDIAPHLVLRMGDHAGVGTLELHDAQQPCHAPLPPDSDECPACARAQAPRPPPGCCCACGALPAPTRASCWRALLLTLASTAATLVPPYLTIPLMDEILIPFQNGQKIDPMLVLLLGGLLAVGLLAWGLGWARTYILALVSERIGADLRTTTFEHLLRLSLDYFGGKRTGDLMARIGSETDRINVFLSLHALDFFTDVLMI